MALAGVAVLLGGLGLYLLIMGLQIHNDYASVMSCHPAHSGACLTLSDLFNRHYYPFAQVFSVFLLAVPVGDREAGAARRRGHRGQLRIQPAVVLVLPAVLRRRPRRTARPAVFR